MMMQNFTVLEPKLLGLTVFLIVKRPFAREQDFGLLRRL
jgi:hypothetical protein